MRLSGPKTDGTASELIACRIADKKTGQRWAMSGALYWRNRPGTGTGKKYACWHRRAGWLEDDQGEPRVFSGLGWEIYPAG